MTNSLSPADAALIQEVVTAVARQDLPALRKMTNVVLPTYPDFWKALSAYSCDFADPSESVLNDSDTIVVPFSDGRGFGLEIPLRSNSPATEVVILVLELIVSQDPHQVRISHHYR